jgi:hypothetical protein
MKTLFRLLGISVLIFGAILTSRPVVAANYTYTYMVGKAGNRARVAQAQRNEAIRRQEQQLQQQEQQKKQQEQGGGNEQQSERCTSAKSAKPEQPIRRGDSLLPLSPDYACFDQRSAENKIYRSKRGDAAITSRFRIQRPCLQRQRSVAWIPAPEG